VAFAFAVVVFAFVVVAYDRCLPSLPSRSRSLSSRSLSLPTIVAYGHHLRVHRLRVRRLRVRRLRVRRLAFSLFLTERNCTYHVNDGLADGLEVDCCTTVMGRAPPGTLEDGHLQALFSSRKALV
jgi:hypothetical protein